MTITTQMAILGYGVFYYHLDTKPWDCSRVKMFVKYNAYEAIINSNNHLHLRI